VRFVSATNRDLDAESQAGRFRGDLYFRLAGYTAMVLPLRQRREEIAELAQGFLSDAAAAMNTTAGPISPAALTMLESYAWPGNARELRNVMQRALLLSDGNPIEVEHLPADRLTMRMAAAPSHSVPPLSSHATTAQNRTIADDRQRIIDVLAQFGGNQTYAARELGMSRGTLLTRMDAFGITRPRKKPRE
jgi:two-component system response regulator AtoC